MAAKGKENKRVVVIGIDDSDFSEGALNYYCQNVMREDDYVVLAHCPELYDLSMASPAVVDELLRELSAKVQALETKCKEKMQSLKLTGKFRTGQGKPGEVLCKIAEEEKGTLMVVGTRGLGKIRRTFLGSVSDYVVHHAHIPVLICRHP